MDDVGTEGGKSLSWCVTVDLVEPELFLVETMTFDT